jgi:prolyl-tRNA synthetase
MISFGESGQSHIFQLGIKYTKSMGMSYLNEGGVSDIPSMGCYRIGVGRLMASVIEESHDARGPIWPWSIAPYHMCVLEAKDAAISQRAQTIYEELLSHGFEVLWDDTNTQAGVQFANADLIGAPIRLVVSPRNESRGVVEYACRGNAHQGEIPAAKLLEFCCEQRAFLGTLPAGF